MLRGAEGGRFVWVWRLGAALCDTLPSLPSPKFTFFAPIAGQLRKLEAPSPEPKVEGEVLGAEGC